MRTAVNVVYDCNVHLQAMVSEAGPAARCLREAAAGRVRLIVDDWVLGEIRSLPEKPGLRRFDLGSRVDAYIALIRTFAVHVAGVPAIYEHPIDPDDSAYVNLALAARAEIIVSRDGHLLALDDGSKPWAADFRSRFPDVRVLTVEAFLARLDVSREAEP